MLVGIAVDGGIVLSRKPDMLGSGYNVVKVSREVGVVQVFTGWDEISNMIMSSCHFKDVCLGTVVLNLIIIFRFYTCE